MQDDLGCLINKANQGRLGDKKYLISAQWWREWCDFVNFDAQTDVENLAFKLNNNCLLSPNEIPKDQYFSVPNNPKRGNYIMPSPEKKQVNFD
jgi:hypothetical protein